ncbi:MAG: 1-acyl-sn-glycerol-3-phosphate acyltransferase [Bacilli bacterium]|nr:1-acyl-sn-glycerol-3-phosphate acyltransferase [Mollicutes bacterium]MDY3898811.1 1-acyl-sn-glycerol-3-phosphate acyltransferase [Bacilli bacterium]
MKNKERIIYYEDELHDDFFNTKTNLNVTIDENYEYLIKNPIRKVVSFILYYFIAAPILYIEGKVFKGVRVKGKRKLKKLKKTGYIMYANHTSGRDAFLGHVFLAHPKRTYIIGNKDAVSIFFVRRLTKDLGTLPTPDTPGALKNLNDTISMLMKKKKALMIYPEAHIWPYYTGVRPFPNTSFRFAVSNNVPCVPVVVTYQKPKGIYKLRKKPQMIVYVGDPIYPKSDVSVKEAANNLRDETYNYLKEMTTNYSTMAYYQYIKKEKEENK